MSTLLGSRVMGNWKGTIVLRRRRLLVQSLSLFLVALVLIGCGNSEAETADKLAEENKAVVDRLWEAYNERDVGILDEVCAENFVHTDPPGGSFNLEELKFAITEVVLNAYPDAQWTIEDTIAEGDKVVTHFTFNGTHEGELMGIPPTGNKVTVTGTGIFHIVDGKIVEWTDNLDYLGMFQQLGMELSPGEG
jgi:steroid delta-isomerase-like uncharacterized protein